MHPSSHLHTAIAHDIQDRRIAAAAASRTSRRARRAARVEGDAPAHSPLPRLRFLSRRHVTGVQHRVA